MVCNDHVAPARTAKLWRPATADHSMRGQARLHFILAAARRDPGLASQQVRLPTPNAPCARLPPTMSRPAAPRPSFVIHLMAADVATAASGLAATPNACSSRMWLKGGAGQQALETPAHIPSLNANFRPNQVSLTEFTSHPLT